ncbi:hypothetical protein [Rhodovulum sp. PH10]|uniref:hypothetical protein n=1 Tax=Rhodovulum sp. PH10 TaxID=1187851 RepID=UPI0012FB1C9F|nr:hypothetical protein [Rhodovulum sp. PH10]
MTRPTDRVQLLYQNIADDAKIATATQNLLFVASQKSLEYFASAVPRRPAGDFPHRFKAPGIVL